MDCPSRLQPNQKVPPARPPTQAKKHPSKETIKRQDKAIQKLTDEFIARIDKIVQAKEKEVLSL